MTFDRDGEAAMLLGVCGSPRANVRAYQQDKRAIYFFGEPIRCVIQTPCGSAEAEVGGVVLHPLDGGRLGVQISFGVPSCSRSGEEEVVLTSGVLSR